MYDGRWRTLIIAEVVMLVSLFAVLAAMFVYVIVADKAFIVSWATLGIAGSAVLGETVRRVRHLRTDLQRYPPQERPDGGRGRV